MAWKDQESQPTSRGQKSQVAAEAMGQVQAPGPKGGIPRAPRFHRMSITAAANGVSINHTIKVKRGKTNKSSELNGASTPMSGQDDMVHHDSDHVFGNDHPVMHHLHAIHRHIMGNLKADGAAPAFGEDPDDDNYND